MNSLRVLVDIDAISAQSSGLGRYTYELARGLRQTPGVEVRCFGRRRWITEPDELARPASLSLEACREVRGLPFRSVLRRVYLGVAGRVFMRRLRRLSGYVYHATNHYPTIPFEGPIVVTVHDLSVVHYPQFHPATRVEAWNLKFQQTIDRADHIIVVSEHVRRDLIDTFGVSPERVSVTYLGVDPAYRQRSAAELQPLAGKYGLTPGAYILCVATIEPRKNIMRLIEAFSAMPGAMQQRHPLVLIGKHGWRSEREHEAIRRLEDAGRVRYPGYVPEHDLPLIYSGARLFAYPSLFEGFGLPVLEAMAGGIPVITSDRTSLPEVAGGAACLIDPEDVGQLRGRLLELLEHEALRLELIEKGLARAANFTWMKTVAATIEVYRKVSKSAGRTDRPFFH